MKLNLPDFEPELFKENEQWYIKCLVRKKWLVLNPEEWVRQHCIHYLKEEKGASFGLMQVEKTQVFNKLKLRFDVALYGRSGILRPGGTGESFRTDRTGYTRCA